MAAMLDLVDSAPVSEVEFDACNAVLCELVGEMNVVHARITPHAAKVLARSTWRQSGRKTTEAGKNGADKAVSNTTRAHSLSLEIASGGGDLVAWRWLRRGSGRRRRVW